MMLPQYLLLVAAGFAGGFFGSAVGSAGLVSLPVLLFLGLSPHAAIGTSRPAAALLELICAFGYRRGKVLTDTLIRRGLILGVAGAVGSSVGAVLIAYIDDQTLRLLLALLISTMAIFLFMKKKWGMIERPERQKNFLFMALATLLTGLYAGLFGFTFGTLITIVLVGFGYTLVQGAAMGRVIGTLTSAASAVVFAWHGYVDYPYALALGLGFAIGGWFGTQYAVRGGNRYIKILLITVILCSVAKLLWDYAGAG